MAVDDVTLVQNVLAGDKHSFNELAARYMPRVFQVAHRFFADRQQVEDIAQDVFLQAYRSLGSYGGERPFGNWLTTIAVRRCYRELKQRAARAERALQELSQDEQVALACLCLGSGSVTPEASLVARDIAERLLRVLPAREQMVLILTEVEGMSVREVAQAMGISQINVKVSNYRARKRARAFLTTLADQH